MEARRGAAGRVVSGAGGGARVADVNVEEKVEARGLKILIGSGARHSARAPTAGLDSELSDLVAQSENRHVSARQDTHRE